VAVVETTFPAVALVMGVLVVEVLMEPPLELELQDKEIMGALLVLVEAVVVVLVQQDLCQVIILGLVVALDLFLPLRVLLFNMRVVVAEVVMTRLVLLVV
jgi:hypothetical protein